jgi:hypothetical protein
MPALAELLAHPQAVDSRALTKEVRGLGWREVVGSEAWTRRKKRRRKRRRGNET